MTIISIPFLIARIVFGVAATIIFLPIIAIVHGISRLAAGQSHTEALSLVGQLKNGEEQTLGAYLTDVQMDIEKLNITIKKSIDKPEEIESISGSEVSSNNYDLLFCRKGTGPHSV